MWVFQYEWTIFSQFTFNFCHHWATLVIQDGGGVRHFLHSKEGVTHGYLLAMITYVLGVLPLIK